MQRTILIVISLLLFFPQITMSQTWNLPPFPRPSPNKEVVMIFATAGPPNKLEIENYIKKYPSIKLRSLFTEAFEGFSVKGKRSELIQLSEVYRKISSTFENHTYHVDDFDSSTLSLIGAEKAQKYYDSKGNPLTGEGIKVGVIDTGVDYTHPDLKKNYSGGYDLVDRDNNPMETLIHQGKPTIHGTHVAGVISANGKMKGVAPKARLYAYRALGPGGTGTTEQVLAAIEKTIKDKMDIINLSLGSNVNGPDLPISKALNKAVEKGVVAVTSNGNSGPNKWTVGTPGTSSKAISVGASTPIMKVPYLSAVPINNPIKLTPLVGSVKWDLSQSYPIEYIGMGKEKDAVNVTGKIALIKRGEIEFTKKVKNAENAGAIAAIIFNNTQGNFYGKIEGSTTIPVMSISKLDGERLLKQWKRAPFLASTIYKEELDFIADFSSRGPVTLNWSIKPDIIAPGVAIKSTIPNNSYIELQGTSMAAPYVAGAAALIKQAHPKWSPNEIKAAIMNTATSLYNKNGKSYKAYEQGAGRINIDQAIQTETLILPGSVSFGLLTNRYDENKQNITVQNMSDQTKHYRFQLMKYNPSIDWRLPLPFTLKPGEKRTLVIKAFIKKEFQNRQEMIEGRFQLVEKDQKIEIPYLFIKEQPSYPRLMGFTIVDGDKPGTIRYEVYLPMGAEEFGIALFDSSTLKFIGYLDIGENIGPGVIENQLTMLNTDPFDQIIAVAFARKNGHEDIQTQKLKTRQTRNGKK